MKKSILVTGSLAFNHIMDFPQTFEENILPEKLKILSIPFLVENLSKNFGGVAGNIAYSLALLGQEVTLLASVGKKDFRHYLKHLQKAGVETSGIKQVVNEFTANMFLITDRNNCQIAGFYPGGMKNDSHLLIKDLKKRDNFDFAVIAPTLPEAMDKFITEAQSLRLPYLFDPAQQIPRLTSYQLIKGIKEAEILIGNDYELALISKKSVFPKGIF